MVALSNVEQVHTECLADLKCLCQGNFSLSHGQQAFVPLCTLQDMLTTF